MIPVDLVAVIANDLASSRRPHDGLLHASSDLVGSLRHSQLRFVNAPTVESDFVADFRTKTGWLVHEYLGNLLVRAGIPVMQEISVTPWLPKGWSGTADWLFWHPEHEAYVLGDLKTTKGESIKWTREGGMKIEHLYQLSAYWHALVEAGFPMLDKFAVLYLPMNASIQEPDIAPLVMEERPVPWETLGPLMEERYAAVTEYARIANNRIGASTDKATLEFKYAVELLAPEQDRIQKMTWSAKDKVWNVSYVPHWSTDFCPYPDELCACNQQGVTKIGHWVAEDGAAAWVPRTKWGKTPKPDNLEPEEMPTPREVKRRMKNGSA